METNDIHAIILAAGRGTRMKCDSPKCLTQFGDEPFLRHTLRELVPVCSNPTIVVGYKGEEVIAEIGDGPNYVWQHELLGTGHAVMCAKDSLAGKDFKTILVLMCDQPLISTHTFQQLAETHKKSGSAITIATAELPNFENEYTPFIQFGRVIRDATGHVDKIAEWKDATEEEFAVKEVNLGMYAFDAEFLWSHLDKLTTNNTLGQYYITDLIEMAFNEGKRVSAYTLKDNKEAFGVNSLEDLEIAKRFVTKNS